ncbi:MAG: molybdenum ABC transporter ATP-binding protein [Pseudomonadales bacterium]|jgi:molybdate transport system ATP-binding protein
MDLQVDLSHEFDDFRLEVSFSTQGDGVTALFGPSGSGKTSILRAVAGLLKPRRGRIAIDDRILLDTSKKTFVAPHRRHLGYVFQDARLFPHLTVAANLQFGNKRAPQPASVEDADRLIALLGLKTLLSRKPAGLSGGERQRVAIGRALLSQPELLLLDEPLASLDAARRAEILPYLERLRDELKTPMLYVSHAVEEVARIADRVVLVDNGEITENAETSVVLARFDASPGDPGAVIRARIFEHDVEYGLTHLAIETGSITVPRLNAAIGTQVRLRIRAQDVLLATTAPEGISANTVLPGIVETIGEPMGPLLDVRVQSGDTRLIARITVKSAERLALTKGRQIFAIIKTATLVRT